MSRNRNSHVQQGRAPAGHGQQDPKAWKPTVWADGRDDSVIFSVVPTPMKLAAPVQEHTPTGR
jgi:hypothetical protein